MALPILPEALLRGGRIRAFYCQQILLVHLPFRFFGYKARCESGRVRSFAACIGGLIGVKRYIINPALISPDADRAMGDLPVPVCVKRGE